MTPTKTKAEPKVSASDPLKPELGLLIKLGSIAVHTEELLSTDGHQFDKVALETLFSDPEVKEWITKMTKMAMLPLKRNQR
jgi:hypothetical protein